MYLGKSSGGAAALLNACAGMASHFLIRDKSGTIAGIGWLKGKMAVHTGDKLQIPAMVNIAYESCITGGDDPSGCWRYEARPFFRREMRGRRQETPRWRPGIAF
jgi:hypothetical protein